MVNTILSGRYRLGERIAAGGMGSVFIATDERLNRKVAVKLLRPELADDPRFTERFRREARAVAALSHPNIAAVFDYGEDDGRQYLVMELVEGRDLARVLREEGPLSSDRSVRIGAQIADALGHAHAAGIVHRDVKPGNVIITKDDRVKVTDFGIARAIGDSTLTATGSVLGSAHYLSPEQASGGNVEATSDIYSLGVVLYEMLTGSLPFTGESLVAVAMRHLSEDMPAPSKLKSGVPAELDDVIARATAKEPADRYRDANELGAALRETLVATGEGAAIAGTGEGTTVWPIPGSRWNPDRVGRWAIGILGGLALIAAALLVYRIATAEPSKGRKAGAGATQPVSDTVAESPTPTPTPTQGELGGIVIPDQIIGADYHEVEKQLVEAGYGVSKFSLDDPNFDKDAIAATEPAPGSVIEIGDTITLYISTGESYSGGDEHGNAYGHDKNDQEGD